MPFRDKILTGWKSYRSARWFGPIIRQWKIMFNPHVDIKRSSSARSPFVLFWHQMKLPPLVELQQWQKLQRQPDFVHDSRFQELPLSFVSKHEETCGNDSIIMYNVKCTWVYYIIRKRTIDIGKLQIGCPPVKYLNKSWRQQNQTKRWSNKIEDIVDMSGLNQSKETTRPQCTRHHPTYLQQPHIQVHTSTISTAAIAITSEPATPT